jgi:hypothetical protein
MLMKNVIVAIPKATRGEIIMAIVSVKNLKKMFIKYKSATKCPKVLQNARKSAQKGSS